MKKMLALVLALMLALTCTAAFADTVYTRVTIDRDLAKQLLPGMGVGKDAMAIVDPVLAVVNALGVNVTSVEDGVQVDLDINGNPALTLGWATDAEGASIVSTLFPNYILTIKNETIQAIMQQMAANTPGGGAGGAGGIDAAALQQVFGSYFQKWMAACAAAGHPGDPVPGEYEFDGVTFDTMVPVTVDMPAIKEATQSLLDELLADPAAMAMLQGMTQGMAQGMGQAGGAADASGFEAQFKAGVEEWMTHFPDTVTAEVYANDGDESGAFYMYAESFREGEDDPFFTANMLFKDQQNMTMGYQMTEGEQITEAGFAMEGSDMSMFFSMGGMYIGLDMSIEDDHFAMGLYFMNPDAPLLTVDVTTAKGGERTLAVDAAGKTALAVEDVMGDQTGQVSQGLMMDIQTNGLGALMGVAMQQIPELASLMAALSGGQATAG